MLTVDYKNQIGSCTMTEKTAEGTQKFQIKICHANCICAFMYFYTDEENGKKVEHAQPVGFISEIAHLKNMLKSGTFEVFDDFKFKAEELNADLWKVIKLLANSGRKITIMP